MRDFEHYSCMIFVLLGVFANVALNMENNDSRLLHIPKKEFLRVICDILASSRTGDAVLASAVPRGDSSGGDAGQSPRRFLRLALLSCANLRNTLCAPQTTIRPSVQRSVRALVPCARRKADGCDRTKATMASAARGSGAT